MTNPVTQVSNAGLLIAVIVSVVFTLGICVLTVALYQQQEVTTSRLDAAVRQEAATRHLALCPVYRRILGNVTPQARAAYPRGVVEYDAGVFEVQRGFVALNCDKP